MQERVFAAPPVSGTGFVTRVSLYLTNPSSQSEGVGTLRLDQAPHGALSNELAGVAYTGSSSDSSSPMDEFELDFSDAGLFSRDDASGTSEASSVSDIHDFDDGDVADDDYFNLALGMQDTPTTAVQPHTSNLLKPDISAAGHPPMPSPPEGAERKKKTFGNLFKRSASSRSIDVMPKMDLRPELNSHDSVVSDTGSAGPSEPPSGGANSPGEKSI
jgi:hypothetical protein